MIRDPYADRESYRALQNAGDLRYFRVTEGETDLMIGASRVMETKALETVKACRTLVQAEIASCPEFQSSLTPLVSPADKPELTLRRCYASHMRSLKEYEKRSDDPEYGPVFARLAQQERDQCRTVLELIGSLGRRTGK